MIMKVVFMTIAIMMLMISFGGLDLLLTLIEKFKGSEL